MTTRVQKQGTVTFPTALLLFGCGSAPLYPFAVIDQVSATSPAEADGIQVGDLLVRFGAVVAGPDCIRQVAAELERSEGLQVPVKVVRRGEGVELSVVPRTWSGRGRLG